MKMHTIRCIFPSRLHGHAPKTHGLVNVCFQKLFRVGGAKSIYQISVRDISKIQLKYNIYNVWTKTNWKIVEEIYIAKIIIEQYIVETI